MLLAKVLILKAGGRLMSDRDELERVSGGMSRFVNLRKVLKVTWQCLHQSKTKGK